jgi:hypothetical protein
MLTDAGYTADEKDEDDDTADAEEDEEDDEEDDEDDEDDGTYKPLFGGRKREEDDE